ncbi:hypothetical protein C3Z06_09355 [Cupriavidus metallidurans]|nr:hypothetical protein C3Z06_09355 [Cupriavidus metallidurans]
MLEIGPVDVRLRAPWLAATSFRTIFGQPCTEGKWSMLNRNANVLMLALTAFALWMLWMPWLLRLC